MIIDEWDALFREAKDHTDLQEGYIQLLRGLFKSSQTDQMIVAAYMTGILPIKKYGTQSALTDFREYTMLRPKKLAGGWGVIAEALAASEEMLEATLAGNGQLVAQRMDQVHGANTSILGYNNENALSCAVTLAYFSAQKEYDLIREMPAGRGFADIVFFPKRSTDKPVLIVELKWDGSVEGAVRQIKERRYPDALKGYGGAVVLVGISYDKKSKTHTCVIEKHHKVF